MKCYLKGKYLSISRRKMYINTKKIKEIWSESEVAQLCLTLCDPMDCSLLGSSVHRIFQAKILEWVTISFSRRSSQPRGSNLDLPHCRQTLCCLSHRAPYNKILCVGIDMGRYIVNHTVKLQNKTHRRKRWRKDKGRKEEEKKREQKRGREGGIRKKAVFRGALL